MKNFLLRVGAYQTADSTTSSQPNLRYSRGLLPKLLLLPLLLSCMLFSGSCSKEDNEYGLPNASTKGRNIFACLVDGDPYIARNEYRDFLFGDDPLVVFSDKPYIIMHTLDHHDEDGIESDRQLNMGLYILPDWSVEGKYIDFKIYKTTSNCYDYDLDKSQPYEFKITRFDPAGTSPRIVSGTFSCKLIEEVCGDTISVTEGRFDVQVAW